MITPGGGVRVWLACGHTDMRKGMDGPAMLAQQILQETTVPCSPAAGWVIGWSDNAAPLGPRLSETTGRNSTLVHQDGCPLP
jgi:hypothetical protein